MLETDLTTVWFCGCSLVEWSVSEVIWQIKVSTQLAKHLEWNQLLASERGYAYTENTNLGKLLVALQRCCMQCCLAVDVGPLKNEWISFIIRSRHSERRSHKVRMAICWVIRIVGSWLQLSQEYQDSIVVRILYSPDEMLAPAFSMRIDGEIRALLSSSSS